MSYWEVLRTTKRRLRSFAPTMVNRGTKLDNGDIAGIVVYFILVVGVGIFVSLVVVAYAAGPCDFMAICLSFYRAVVY